MTIPDGWIDLQVNGFLGVDFTKPGLSVEDVHSVSRHLVEQGVGAYCPTLITAPEEYYQENLPVLAEAMEDQEWGQHLLGIHLEGPSFNLKCSGAHPEAYIRDPDLEAFRRWNAWADGKIILHTLAPELPGAISYIEALSAEGVVMSLGHHLADAETTRQAIQAGARVCTHLGNGIPNTLDRHHNPIIDQLAEPEMEVMFIPDGFHLPVNVIKLIRGMKDISQCIAVSDAAPIAGLASGNYNLWTKNVVLTPEGCIRQQDGSSLAGSSRNMTECMNFLKSTGIFSTEELNAAGRDNALRLLGKEG